MKNFGKQYQKLKYIIQVYQSLKNNMFINVQKGNILVNGEEDSDMEKELCNGQMEQDMKDNGKWVEHLVEEYLLILKERYMMENGNMIKRKDKVNIFIQMELNMMVNGYKIYKKEKAQRNGQMVQYLQDYIKKEKRME